MNPFLSTWFVIYHKGPVLRALLLIIYTWHMSHWNLNDKFLNFTDLSVSMTAREPSISSLLFEHNKIMVEKPCHRWDMQLLGVCMCACLCVFVCVYEILCALCVTVLAQRLTNCAYIIRKIHREAYLKPATFHISLYYILDYFYL